MDSLVQMYMLEGDKIHKEVSKYEISATKLKQLKNNFDAVDSGKLSSMSMVRSHKRRSWLVDTEISIVYSTQKSLITVVPLSSRWNGAHSKKKEVEIHSKNPSSRDCTGCCPSAVLQKCQFLNKPPPQNNKSALIHHQSSSFNSPKLKL